MNKESCASVSRRKKIWIDLDNSPHVPFFKPIIDELNRRGYRVMLTARDCFQVCGLADLLCLRYKRIGRHYGKNKILKVAGLFIRAIEMAPTVLKQKPAFALFHGSRSQLLLASILRIPCCDIADYEYSQRLIFIHPNWIIVPELIPYNALHLPAERVRKYPGIKEDVYVPSFTPDPDIYDELGLNQENIIVTIRPPATEAHYHDAESELLFKEVIDFLGGKSSVRMVLLPRNDHQSAFLRTRWPRLCSNGKITIPDHVVDGLNLISMSLT